MYVRTDERPIARAIDNRYVSRGTARLRYSGIRSFVLSGRTLSTPRAFSLSIIYLFLPPSKSCGQIDPPSLYFRSAFTRADSLSGSQYERCRERPAVSSSPRPQVSRVRYKGPSLPLPSLPLSSPAARYAASPNARWYFRRTHRYACRETIRFSAFCGLNDDSSRTPTRIRLRARIHVHMRDRRAMAGNQRP